MCIFYGMLLFIFVQILLAVLNEFLLHHGDKKIGLASGNIIIKIINDFLKKENIILDDNRYVPSEKVENILNVLNELLNNNVFAGYKFKLSSTKINANRVAIIFSISRKDGKYVETNDLWIKFRVDSNNHLMCIKYDFLDNNIDIIDAVIKNDIDTVKRFIQAGANLNIKDKDGRTPLMYAIREDNEEIVKLLEEAGAKE